MKKKKKKNLQENFQVKFLQIHTKSVKEEKEISLEEWEGPSLVIHKIDLEKRTLFLKKEE